MVAGAQVHLREDLAVEHRVAVLPQVVQQGKEIAAVARVLALSVVVVVAPEVPVITVAALEEMVEMV